MNYFSKPFLLEHCQSIFHFYDANILDSSGGYQQNFYDDGAPFNSGFKQLVSSTRIIVNYALGASILNKPEYKAVAQHGLNYLENVHWQNEQQAYAWTLQDHQPQDMTQQAYGYAFVLLAYSACLRAGVIKSADKIHQTYDLLESRFWQAEHGLYADTLSLNGKLDGYRGQNANMHICEAMIAAFEATQEKRFLNRATTIAQNICIRQANLSNGLVWEHFTENFSPDWQYNKHDPQNLYRPWGFQPGHQTEWAKLLLQINRHTQSQWLIKKAEELHSRAFEKAWDHEHGGLIYGFDLEGEWCDTDKYFWVQAETFAAAALLYQTTGEPEYLNQYQQLWNYAWAHFVDHQHGAWYRVLDIKNNRYSNEKSAAGAKCDYHTLGACFEVIRALDENQSIA